MADNINLRELALETMLDYEKKGRKINDTLSSVLEKYAYLPKQERAFYARLVEGTVENLINIDYIIDCYSKTPVSSMKPIIRNILRLSVYQIKYMDSVPDSAAVNEAVKLAGRKKFFQLKAFINAVLRSLIREPEKSSPDLIKDRIKRISVKYSMPEFLVRKWDDIYKEETESICEAFLKEKKTTVRFTGNEEEREGIVSALEEQGISVEKLPALPYAYNISNYDSLFKIKEFSEGKVIVQDISSMLCVEAAGIREARPKKILDICAAPGGKSLLVSELADDDAEIISRDISEAKTALIKENTDRCRINNIRTQVWDALNYDRSLDESMDLVIADLPCSGYGVIGHKSDIKYGASAEKEDSLVKIQRAIIDNAVKYLRAGGRLLYSTCTINKTENEDNVEYILKKGNMRPEDITEFLPERYKNTTAKKGYLQLLPNRDGCDGFFLSVFTKE